MYERKQKHKRKSPLMWFAIVMGFVVLLLISGVVIAAVSVDDKLAEDLYDNGENPFFHEEQDEEWIPEAVDISADGDIPFWKWYGYSEDKSERLKHYELEVQNIINRKPMYGDTPLEELPDEDRETYNNIKKKVDAREASKIPPQYEGQEIVGSMVTELLTLTHSAYWDIAQMTKQLYLMCPSAAMIQRVGRNAGDALIVALDEEIQVEADIWMYASESVEGYTALFNFWTTTLSVSDRCYWIGDVFYQIAWHMDNLKDEEREHCYLTAYYFFYWGVIYMQESDTVEHANDLRQCLENVAEHLKNDYGYELPKTPSNVVG